MEAKILIYCNREFRPVNIPGYSNYMVSKEGDIYSIDRNRLLKHVISEYGTHKIVFQTDRHCEKHKFQVSNVVKATWDIDIDNKGISEPYYCRYTLSRT